MYYKSDEAGELSKAEMDAVRSGFTRMLVKRRYHPEFVFKHRDELLATAHAEYVRYLGKGVEIKDPVAWMIHCAWRRMQNVLVASNSRPADLSSEVLAELVDEATPTPAQIAEDADRVRKVHRAISKLDPAQRQVVALVYFEDMPLAEAARRLGWHESKARRCHETAMKHLYKSLAVKSSDQLAAEIGLAAWLSFAGSSSALHLPAGFEAALDKASEGASGLWVRVHDLARRLTLGGGGDTAAAVTTSGAGRAAGACATVAVACLASGIVGPGVGGSLDLFGHSRQLPSTNSAAPTDAKGELQAPGGASAPTASFSTSGSAKSSKARDETASSERASASSVKTASQQVAEQTSGLARAGSEYSASTGSESASAGPTTSNSGRPSASESQTQQQFDAFK